MSTIKVEISKKGLRKDTVNNKLRDFIQKEFPEATVSVSVYERPESRADRFSEAQGMVADAQSEFESLRDELQEWFDNLPEGFQQGDKGSALEEAIQELETALSSCDEIGSCSPEFPGMY